MARKAKGTKEAGVRARIWVGPRTGAMYTGQIVSGRLVPEFVKRLLAQHPEAAELLVRPRDFAAALAEVRRAGSRLCSIARRLREDKG